MPAETEAQRKMMCADLARLREGKKTKTGMTEAQLVEFCGTPSKEAKTKKK